MFFVATAPSVGGGVNVPPKGYDSFRVLDEGRVCYLDLTGSGAETIAHLRDNERVTFMFCAFEGKPNIVRLYGSGRHVQPGDPEFDDLIVRFPDRSGVRSIVVADIDRTPTSCVEPTASQTHCPLRRRPLLSRRRCHVWRPAG